MTYAPATEENKVKVTDIFQIFSKNRAFVALCIHGVCICTMQYVSSTLGTYMYSDVLGSIGLMSMTTVISMPLMILVLVVSPKLAKKLGLENMIRYSLLISSLLYVGLFAAHVVAAVNPWVHIIWSLSGLRRRHGLHPDAVGPGGRSHRL